MSPDKDCLVCLLLLFASCLLSCRCQDAEEKTTESGERKMAEYARSIIDHYKQKDPVGFPGAPIPDPARLSELAVATLGVNVRMTNVELHGLKNFQVERLELDLARMIADVVMTFKKLDAYGNYTISPVFGKIENGPFMTNLSHVTGKAIVQLEVEHEGYLEAQVIDIDMSFEDLHVQFKNRGAMATIAQSTINRSGAGVFNVIKPFIKGRTIEIIRQQVNSRTRQLPQRIPNSVSPIDQLVSLCRQMVRNQGYDPLQVKNYNTSFGMFNVKMTQTWLSGLSSFHRVGNMTFKLKDNVLHGQVEVGTLRLKGTSNWEIGLVGGIFTKVGTIKFTVEHFKASIVFEQHTDIRNKPRLNDLQLELGNIQVRFDGAGTLDYVIEFAVNVLPNILRYQIMDAIEGPIKRRIQEELNFIDLERFILENADKYDEGRTDFTLPIKL